MTVFAISALLFHVFGFHIITTFLFWGRKCALIVKKMFGFPCCISFFATFAHKLVSCAEMWHLESNLLRGEAFSYFGI